MSIPVKIPDFLTYEWDEKPDPIFYRALYASLEALRVSLNTLFHRGFDQPEKSEVLYTEKYEKDN